MFMEMLTDEQLISIINRLQTVNALIPVRQGELSAFAVLEILAIEHLNLRKKFHILENSFIDFCAEKRDNSSKEKAVMD